MGYCIYSRPAFPSMVPTVTMAAANVFPSIHLNLGDKIQKILNVTEKKSGAGLHPTDLLITKACMHRHCSYMPSVCHKTQTFFTLWA